ncbi:DMT family transporter [Rhodocaloribacter sp.]
MSQHVREVTAEEAGAREPGAVAAVSPETDYSHHSVLLLFVFIWGGNFVLAEVALREMAPISFSVSRFLVGGAAMLAILYVQRIAHARNNGRRFQLFPRLERRDWPRLLWLSVLGATLAPWLGIEGLGLTHGARASLWLALGPVMSAGMGYFLNTERIGRVGRVGLALAGLGTLGLALDGLDPARGYWLGDLMLFFAIVLAAGELHLIKPLAARYGPTPMVTARTVIGGALYLLVASPSLAEQAWLSLGVWTWIAIVLGGGIGVGVGQWVKVRALRSLGPTRVVLYGNLVPLAALALAWLTIGTVPSVLELAAGSLIILGALLLQVIDAPRRFSPGVEV